MDLISKALGGPKASKPSFMDLSTKVLGGLKAFKGC